MKKIYINEGFISNVVKGRLLPQFLFKLVKTHTTSLGDSEAFPTSDEYPFDYTLLKGRFNEVCDNIEKLNLESLDEDYLVSELSSLVTRCKELESPIRDTLERICENALNRLFAIPENILNLRLKLVDKIKFKGAVRMKPESNSDLKYTFKDVADIDLSNKSIAKRRFVNALIQGASYTYSNIEGLYVDDIDKINQELPRLYRKIRIINDYLLFIKKEEMSDDKPMQGSYVETHLGVEGNKTTIKVQGIIFPLLLHEAIKGLFELFSAHGLPQDKKKAQFIIKKADFVLAEPWDLRLGVGLWNIIFGRVKDTNMIPYMFTSLIKMPTDEFNLSVKEILSNTEKGVEIIDSLMKDAEYDNGYQQFTNRINAKNLEKSLIKDSYFNGAETNGYDLDYDDADGDVIEEDDVDESAYPSLGIKNDGIETWYRGICGTFDELKTKRQIWLTDGIESAAYYAYECEDGHLYEFDIDTTRLNLYDWYYEADSYFEPIDGFSEEEQMELMKEGYNGYSFALDDATVLVLFDKSLITNIREIPLNNYINEGNNIEVDPNSEIKGILANATVDNIDFVEGDVNDYGEEVLLSVDGIEIPREFVQLDFRPIYKRFPTGKHQLLNIDIILAPQLRGMGLGTKIYAKAVKEFGAICSRHSTRHNDDGIRGIFSKLEAFNDIKVIYDEYQNIENEPISDYYAILKSQLPRYFGNNITENRKLIYESQESKSIAAAKKLVMQRLNYDEQEADEFIRIKLRNDIPSLRTPQGGKFILGVTRMFCDGELRTANDIGNLNSTLKLVASDAHINEYDRNLNGMSAQELIQRFAKAMSDNLEAEKNEVSQMVFSTPSDYEIVRIDSFEQAEKYGDYVSWCVTHNNGMFNSYTSDGMNQFYFCLKNGFENVEPQPSEGCPLDEYGLSMIAVSVNENGMLNTCTCRWNHDNGGNDSIMNAKEVSQVIGMNFFEVFKPNNKWKGLIANVKQRLANGEDPRNVFDSVGYFREGFASVNLNGKYNSINQEGRFLSDQWFDYVGIFREGFARVNLNRKCNFINQEGRILSDQWFDDVEYFRDGFARVKLNGKWNYINQEGRILSDQWFDSAYDFRKGFAVVELNDKYNYINQEGGLLSEQWFDYVDSFCEGFAEVVLNNKWNFINQEGRLISDQWFDYVYDFRYGFAEVELNGKSNFINQEGRLLSDQWFDKVYGFREGFARVKLNGKDYRLDTNGNLSLIESN